MSGMSYRIKRNRDELRFEVVLKDYKGIKPTNGDLLDSVINVISQDVREGVEEKEYEYDYK